MSKWDHEGYMEEVETVDVASVEPEDDDEYFVTVFMVERETTHGKSYRPVVNGARKFKGKCINDYLWPGPNEMLKIFDVLIRARRYDYILNTDIKSMFLRLNLREEDRKYVRFFYRPTPQDELKVWQFTSHVFGLTSSPCVAILTLKHHAAKRKDEFPLAHQLTTLDTMVDDVLSSLQNERTLLKAYEELTDLYEDMGLVSHKWASNSKQLMQRIPEGAQAKSVSFGDIDRSVDESLYIRTLGMLYCCTPDVFKFVYKPHIYDADDWTLRRMASNTGSLYDPLQLLIPVTVRGKLYVQTGWRYELGWDTLAPESLGKLMSDYCKEFECIGELEIDRSMHIEEDSEACLVVFVDASSVAMAAAAYVVSFRSEGTQSSLLCGRSKLCPVKGQDTIPRLELAACVVGMELATSVCRCYGWSVNDVIYYSDSMTALWWLQSTKVLSAYVGSRVMRILQRSDVAQWRHVSTTENPADLPTRGIKVKDLMGNDLWWHGPSFLTSHPNEWPTRPEIMETTEAAAEARSLEEICKQLAFTVEAIESPEDADPVAWLILTAVRRVHGLKRGFRAFRNYTKFLNAFIRQKTTKKVSFPVLTDEEMELKLVKEFQRIFFDKVLLQIRSKKPLDKPYCDMALFIDEDGVLRTDISYPESQGRFVKTVKRPLLSRYMELATWLFKEAHEISLRHGGTQEAIRGEMAKKYVTMGDRIFAKKTYRSCPRCSLHKRVKPLLPAPPTHESRLGLTTRYLRPFVDIGVDLAGPFNVVVNRKVQLRFLMIICCCVTRCVNVEVCYNLTGEAALHALRRHMVTYGRPKVIKSDQGWDFVKCAREFQERIDSWRRLKHFDRDQLDPVRWLVNPPADSPTWTAHIETIVKLVKSAMRRIRDTKLGNYTPDEFHTVSKEAGGFCNLRPYGQNSNKETPTVPADFVLTGHDVLFAVPETEEMLESMTYRYQAMAQNLIEIWETFQTEYLTEVRRRQEKCGVPSRLKVGDVVALQERKKKKADWPTGQIIEAFPGVDGETRSFRIKLFGKDSTLTRNWRTLVKIPRPDEIPNL